ncbi:Membrane protein tms1 [Malassezia caprae]|uniref:Membrane protein tms1 n=1 Tax=Malassezia caprae TaxID=1381934 RepID=A0AAF0IYX7_9BASI|nr:Membrane protein tms1 [Malassezia caprae]
MGAVLSVPWLLSPVASCCTAACVSLCTSAAASMICQPCHFRSSVATRVGYAMLFCVDALVAWLSLAPSLARSLEHWTVRYVQLSCIEQETCVGVLAVHRITFALALLHLLLAALLVDVHDSRAPKAAIQNGWWGPKVFAWLLLVTLAFLLPSGFFLVWANYIAPCLALVFILQSLVLLVDFAHAWAEECLDRWERGSELHKYLLLGSTLGTHAFAVLGTILLFVYFGRGSCTGNRYVLWMNLALYLGLTFTSIHPRVQEANPRSGLAQCGIVVAYMTYLVASALMQHDDEACNPVARGRGEGVQTSTVVLSALFTFATIAYSTTRAATHSPLMRDSTVGGPITLEATPVSLTEPITTPPAPQSTLRIAAIRSAVEAGSLPSSVLDEELDAQANDMPRDRRHVNDDEYEGVRYHYSKFHLIFVPGICYTAMLLTDWQSVQHRDTGEQLVTYIGTSSATMWIRIMSAWVCGLAYQWSLLAPVLLPDRFT